MMCQRIKARLHRVKAISLHMRKFQNTIKGMYKIGVHFVIHSATRLRIADRHTSHMQPVYSNVQKNIQNTDQNGAGRSAADQRAADRR